MTGLMKLRHPDIVEFETITKDAVRVQVETLARILKENADSEYLRNHGLAGRTDPESFKSCVPLATHKDFKPYIQRIADGDSSSPSSSILTTKPIPQISLSSGTTQGKPKYIPFNDHTLSDTMEIYKTSNAYRHREYPLAKGKGLQLVYAGKQGRTKGGLLLSTATTHVFSSDEYRRVIKETHCSPEEVVFGNDFQQSTYCHLLCALLLSTEVEFVFSKFGHLIVQAFRTFEQMWEQLCSDIREGVLSKIITVPAMRSAVSKLLVRPNPDLANSIESKCKSVSDWYGVIPALFPNAKYVYGILTGAMEPYVNKLRHYAGDLPLVSAYYGASEGWIGACIDPTAPPESATFTILPHIGYFEFIPIHDGCQGVSRPVGIEDLVVGKEYEILITNSAGLYRYNIGDVVRVAGFHNAAPKLKFVCRRDVLLSINIDKNSEKDVQIAVDEAGELLKAENCEVVDFTSYADRSTQPGHYVIFVEINGRANEKVLEDFATFMDLSFLDAGYLSSRKTNGIGALEVRVVKSGTFGKILNHYTGAGAAVSQFKTPRCIGATNDKVLDILITGVDEKYFSNAYK